MDLKIRLACRGAGSVNYKTLVNFQGDLKTLSEEAYQRIRSSIIRFGFMEPISVWNDEGVLKMLNGHQRLTAVKRMVELEGFKPIKLPVNYIDAENYEDAKLRVLALTSDYGQMTQAGAVNYLADMNVTHDDLVTFLQLRQVDLSAIFQSAAEAKLSLPPREELTISGLLVGASNDPIMPTPYKPKAGSTEISASDFDKFDHTCPKCGFGFN